MSLEQLTEQQLLARLDMLDEQIAKAQDWKSLPTLNSLYQQIIQELARRDVAAADAR